MDETPDGKAKVAFQVTFVILKIMTLLFGTLLLEDIGLSGSFDEGGVSVTGIVSAFAIIPIHRDIRTDVISIPVFITIKFLTNIGDRPKSTKFYRSKFIRISFKFRSNT